jgi:hypothetical protein
MGRLREDRAAWQASQKGLVFGRAAAVYIFDHLVLYTSTPAHPHSIHRVTISEELVRTFSSHRSRASYARALLHLEPLLVLTQSR